MHLLDSGILIFLLRGDRKVTESLESRVSDPKALSVISYGELLYGAMRSARPVKNAARVRRLGEVIPVVDVSPGIMETFADIKAGLEGQGTRIDDFDLIVAATALHLNYTLVTNNVRHFQPVPGITVENWAK